MEIINQIIEDKIFKKIPAEEYYIECQFINCNFSQVATAGVIWENCTFDTCDFSLCKLKNMSFRDVLFKGCKLMGADFSICNPFSSFRFEYCQMNYTNFHEMKISKTNFIECELIEAYFEDTNLQGSHFIQCNLERALFHHTNLMGVDFSTSYNYTIQPQNNKLKNALFSRSNLEGLVTHLGIKLID